MPFPSNTENILAYCFEEKRVLTFLNAFHLRSNVWNFVTTLTLLVRRQEGHPACKKTVLA